MKVQIPEADERVLKDWVIGGGERADQFLAAVEAAPPSIQRKEFVTSVASALAMAEADVDAILQIFMDLAFLLTTTPSEGGHREDLVDSVFVQLNGDVSDVDLRKRFKDRVQRIHAALEVMVKAMSLLRDHAKMFDGARTLSELRPVFREDGLQTAGMVITHQLKLSYETPDGGQDDVFIGLRRRDLDTLKVVIDRAIEKDKRLVEIAEGARLPVLR